MSRILLFVCSLLITVQLSAQAPVEVKKVDFRKTKEDWIQMEVELDCAANTLADAKDEKFIENIGVKVYLAYEREASKNLYDYYSAEVRIAIAEANEQYNVYFYLPGLIAERDQFSKAQPAFFYVALDIASQELKPRKGSPAMSGSIKNLQILNSFLAKAKESSSLTDGLLMPSYYAPSAFKSRVQKQPLYLRLDPKPAGQ